jgi:hypothetical protein
MWTGDRVKHVTLVLFINLKNHHMKWIYINPTISGYYIVQTTTSFSNNNTLEAYFNGKKWSFSNQVLFRYLEQP